MAEVVIRNRAEMLAQSLHSLVGALLAKEPVVSVDSVPICAYCEGADHWHEESCPWRAAMEALGE